MVMDDPRYRITGPNPNRQEQEVTEALALHSMPSEGIRALQTQRPELFPPRLGYPDNQATIQDILGLDLGSNLPEHKRQDYRTFISGGPAGFSSTSRPSAQDVF
jgi:hypothetical protein